MLSRVNRVVGTRDVTWEATLGTGAPLPPLPEMPEQVETMDLEEAPEPGGTDDYESAPTTPLPIMGRGIPRHLRAVSPTTQTSGDFQAESVELNDSSTVSSKPPNSDTSSRGGNDVSSSDEGAPTRLRPGLLRARPGDGDEIREGRTRAQTRALNREGKVGLISTIGPCEGGRIFHVLLAAQDTGGEPTRLPDCLLKEAGTEPTSYSAAR